MFRFGSSVFVMKRKSGKLGTDNDCPNGRKKLKKVPEANGTTDSVVRTICLEDSCMKFPTRKCSCDPYNSFIRAGPYILGCQWIPVGAQSGNIDHYVARKIDDPDSDRFYFIKIVTLPEDFHKEIPVQRLTDTKILMYNEYSVLSLLKGHPGVHQVRDFFLEYFYQENSDIFPEKEIPKCLKCLKLIKSYRLAVFDTKVDQKISDSSHHFLECEYLRSRGKFMRRLVLVFDCFLLHLFRPRTAMFPCCRNMKSLSRNNHEYENLQEYLKRCKNIPELKALQIFSKVVEIIHGLHEKNIAHLDLRLENILYNHLNGEVLIINFGHARYVINDNVCINDRRGSSAYISPDVLKRRPYPPKASDCWALGIIFYTMLFGKFPFYAEQFNELFKKINSANYCLPEYVVIWDSNSENSKPPSKPDKDTILISADTMSIVRSLIVTDISKRFNISDLHHKLKYVLKSKLDSTIRAELRKLVERKKCVDQELQVVPDMDQFIYRNALLKHNLQVFFDEGFKFTSQDAVICDSITKEIVFETIKMLESETLDKNVFKDCLKLVTNSIRSERMNIRGDRTNTNNKHLRDHDYVQTNPEEPEHEEKTESDSNAFDAYLSSSRNFSPHRLLRPYLTSRNRFCEEDAHSMVRHRLGNRSSLLLDELIKQSTGLSPIIPEEKTKWSGSNKLKATVIKVDSDVRPLNEHEYNLVNMQFRCSSSFNSNN